MPLKIYQQIILGAYYVSLTIGTFLIVKGYGTELGWWKLDATSFWTLLGNWADAAIALIGTCVVSLSIYFEKVLHGDWRPADWLSYYILAPIAISTALGSLIWMVCIQQAVPDVVNGYGILGLVGAIARLLPFSEGQPYTISKLHSAP